MKLILQPILLLSFIISLNLACSQEDPQNNFESVTSIADSAHQVVVSSGDIDRYKVGSDFVDARHVDVWLPENYSEDQRYAVLYMHDGQMLFDSTKTWNNQEWKVDEIASRLMKENRIKDIIAVGVWNNGKQRYAEYFPEKAINYIPKPQRDSLLALPHDELKADRYLKFLVTELKPFIDQKYATLTGPGNTVVMGSSMGGLISMYALTEYPDVFGSAGCLSTHFMGIGEPNDIFPNAFNNYLKENLPSAGNHKLYFDHGTETLDANYAPYQDLIDQTMRERGYTSQNWITREFEGHDHSEKSWSKRLHIPLKFLLAKENQQTTDSL